MDAVQPLQKHTQRSREEISSFTRQWRASGKNKITFCRENNLNYMTFIGWTAPKKKTKKTIPGFIPLKIHKATTGIFAEINLPGGSKVIFHSPVRAQYLKDILR